ncbi:MAG: HAD hydrolase-like protein [Polyangiaceae bacterium]|nr:HAD hydrolase-like protein [Polyangiaceae bacterium]
MNLLFDLDGTLTDSRPGILASMRWALGELGLAVPSDEALTRFIGPPTHIAFRELVATDDRAILDRAVALYRDRFTRLGMFENSLYPGIRDGLAALRSAGCRLWVATSKPEVYARRIIHHFALRDQFVEVYGSELDGERGDKADLIAHLLSREQLEGAGTWMIGDRVHDIVGAHKNGLRAAGALWGYGAPAELEAACADARFATMADVVAAFTLDRR